MKKLAIIICILLFSAPAFTQIQIRNSESDSKQPTIQKLQGGIILNLKQKKVPVKMDKKWRYIWKFKQLWIPPNTSWTEVKKKIDSNNLGINAFELAKIRAKYQKHVKYDPDKMELKNDRDIKKAIRNLNKRLKKLEGR